MGIGTIPGNGSGVARIDAAIQAADIAERLQLRGAKAR
jgi:hypothetical protein